MANSIAADDTGIYIVGFTKVDSEDRGLWIVEKRDPHDGSLIWSKVANPEEGSFVATDVALDNSDMYIVGSDDIPGDREWRIEKRGLTEGELKWSQTSNPISDYDYATGIAVDDTGLYIIGMEGPMDDASWRIEKRALSDGGLIWHRKSNPSPGDDVPYGIAVDSTGMYIVGFDNLPGGRDYAWRIEKRALSDGSLIWSNSNNPSAISDSAQAVAVDSFGLFIVGYDGNITRNRWRVEKRNPSNGELIWNHTIERPAEYHSDIAVDIALDETSAIIVGHVLLETQVGRIEKITKGTIIQSEPDQEQGPKGIPGFPLPAILLGLVIALLMRSRAAHKGRINHPYYSFVQIFLILRR